MPRRANLVVVMAGDESLHEHFSGPDREYDIWVIYYADSDEIFGRYAATADRAWKARGLKIQLIRTELIESLHLTRAFDFSTYRYVFFPDDDIRFAQGTADLNRMFRLVEALRADVFQPAIANENVAKLWEPTAKVPHLFARRTNIVEVMMNGFSSEALVKAYFPAIHALEFVQSGWGVEPFTQKIGETVLSRPLRTFVLDSVSAEHTRAAGSNGAVHRLGKREARFIPQIETNRMVTLKGYETLEQAVAEDDLAQPEVFLSRRDEARIARYMQPPERGTLRRVRRRIARALRIG